MTQLPTSQVNPKCEGCPLRTVEEKLKQLQITVTSINQMIAELAALIAKEE